MVYADYDFYLNEYFGRAISETDFSRLALRGSQYLDYITQGRAARNPGLEALKMACCALAEQYQQIDSAQKAQNESLSDEYTELQSESVGSWSRSFGNTADMAGKISEAARAELTNIVRYYLAHTGLLYRGGGCRPCE